MNKENAYNGNTNLKRAGAPINLTKEQLAEWVKCAEDPIYFAEKYIQIVHVDHGLIPIRLYDFQKEIIDKFFNNRRVVVGTSRQAGKTTTAVCVILHYVLFNKAKQVGLLANKGDSAREILERIQIAYEALPKWLQWGVKEWNKGSVILENGCKIIASATSGSAARGKSFALLYIDETAFVENWEEFSASVLPTISSGKKTKLLYTSTPKGLNHFHKIFTEAKQGKNGFAWVEAPWWKVPGRDEEWKQDILSSIGNNMEQFAQEYCVEFMGSSGTLIAGWKLKELVAQEPVHQDNFLKVYKKPLESSVYIIIVDVSRAKGLDYSAFSVFDVSKMPYEQVAVYRSNLVSPTDYANIINNVGLYYNSAAVLIEINDIGGQVADLLHMDYDYDNLLKTVNRGRKGKALVTWAPPKQSDRGIRTTTQVKRTGCSLLKLLIEQNQLIINDHETIHELSTFSEKGSSYEAEPGKNDDLVMGLVLFAWASTQKYFKEMSDTDTMAQLREQTEEEIEQYLLPFGIVDTGVETIGRDSPSEFGWF